MTIIYELYDLEQYIYFVCPKLISWLCAYMILLINIIKSSTLVKNENNTYAAFLIILLKV